MFPQKANSGTLRLRNAGSWYFQTDRSALYQIKVQGVGDTKLNINAPAIRFLCQAVGNISIKGKCGSITSKNQSEGDLNAMGLIAEVLSIRNMAAVRSDIFR